jgi:hypothetical protein
MLYGDLDFLEGCVYIDTNEGGKRKEKKERKSQPKTGCTYIYTCIYIYIGQCFSMALGLCLWGDIKRNGRIGSPQDLRHWADHKLAIPGKSPSRPILCFYIPPVFSFSSAQEHAHVVPCSNGYSPRFLSLFLSFFTHPLFLSLLFWFFLLLSRVWTLYYTTDGYRHHG